MIRLTHRGRSASRILYEVALILLTILFLYPFYAVITLSLKSPEQALFHPMAFPRGIFFQNFQDAWRDMKYPQAFLNSLVVTFFGSVGIVLVAALASFTVARHRNKWTTFLYFFLLSGLLVPYYMTLSPLVKLMRDLKLINSLGGLALSYVGRGIPLAVFLYVGFMRAIPGEIMDSAIVDGCQPVTLLLRIVGPMTNHISMTLIILNVLWIWNDFLFPLLTLQSVAKRTIPVAQFIFHGSYSVQWNLLFASYLLSMLPLLLVYFFLQRYIVSGIATGALKG
jgi:raffinose/stachyose/melibiose transport system permease protein